MKLKNILFPILLLALLASVPMSAKKHRSRMLTRAQDTIFWHTPTVAWSIEAGYAQPWLKYGKKTFCYMNGAQLGFRVDWNLLRGKGFGLSTGGRLQVATGKNTQYGPRASYLGSFQQECVNYDMRMVNLIVPLQVRYDVRMYKDWHIFFFGGANLNFGLAFRNKVENLLSREMTTDDYGNVYPTRAMYAAYDPQSWSNMDTGTEGMYKNGRVWPFSLEFGVGGGIRWKHWSIQAGYDFGVTNQSRLWDHKDNPLNTWRWQAGIAYTF